MNQPHDSYDDGISFGLLLSNLQAAESLIGMVLDQADAVSKHGHSDRTGLFTNRIHLLASRAAQLSAALDKASAALPAEQRKAA